MGICVPYTRYRIHACQASNITYKGGHFSSCELRVNNFISVTQDIVMDRRKGTCPDFGHLRFVDYVGILYCVLRILGESQALDLQAEVNVS